MFSFFSSVFLQVLGGLRRAILSTTGGVGGGAAPDPAMYGLWGALLRRLRTMLHQPAKVNLLLSHLLTTLAQFTPPLWRCYVFSLSSGRQSGVPTLYETLAEVAAEIRQMEAAEPGLRAAVVAARALVHDVREVRGENDGGSSAQGRMHSGGSDGDGSPRSLTPSSPRTSVDAGGSGGGSGGSSKLGPNISGGVKPNQSSQAGNAMPDSSVSNRVVNGVVLFEELIKELAAVALEQSVANPPIRPQSL